MTPRRDGTLAHVHKLTTQNKIKKNLHFDNSKFGVDFQKNKESWKEFTSGRRYHPVDSVWPAAKKICKKQICNVALITPLVAI